MSEQKQKILFSLVGKTDPISNHLDGALLHICRHYKPDIVYMYMSKETTDFDHKDGRYSKALELLQEKTSHHFEVRKIERKDLVKVHIFDYFMEEFRKLLEEIRSEFPDGEIFLNVSSGTPAMKSALQNLSVILPIHMTPLQLSSEGRSNGNNGEAYDILTEWENNADNAPGAAKRVEESSNKNLLFEFNRRIMEKLIDRYDYKAVQTMVNEMRELVPSQFKALLKAAINRYDLKCSEARSAFTRLGYPNMMQPKYTRECEYLLLLQIQVQTKAYSDFLRSITPFILAIFQSALEKMCGYSIHDYIKPNDKWDESKLTGSALDGKFEQQRIYEKYHTLPPKPLSFYPTGTEALTTAVPTLPLGSFPPQRQKSSVACAKTQRGPHPKHSCFSR